MGEIIKEFSQFKNKYQNFFLFLTNDKNKQLNLIVCCFVFFFTLFNVFMNLLIRAALEDIHYNEI